MTMKSSASNDGALPFKASTVGDCFEVRITVLTFEGVVAKRFDPKTKKLVRKASQALKPSTSNIVVSFSQDVSANKSFLTHLPSSPMEHLDVSVSKTKLAPQPTVRWPTSMEEDEGLSTLRFTRRFQQKVASDDASSSAILLPETFPINLSLSRRGKLITLGTGTVLISGEEKEESNVAVPIKSTIKKTGINSPMKKSRSKRRIPMMRMKGDDLQFGLRDDSSLGVQVSLTKVHDDNTDITDEIQEDEISQKGCEDNICDPICDPEECEVNDVTFELQDEDECENFLDSLNGEEESEVEESDEQSEGMKDDVIDEGEGTERDGDDASSHHQGGDEKDMTTTDCEQQSDPANEEDRGYRNRRMVLISTAFLICFVQMYINFIN